MSLWPHCRQSSLILPSSFAWNTPITFQLAYLYITLLNYHHQLNLPTTMHVETLLKTHTWSHPTQVKTFYCMPIPVRIMSKRPSMIWSLLSSSSFSCPTLHTVLSYHQNFAHLNVFFGIYFPTSSLFFIRSLLIQQFFKWAFSDP